MFWTAILIFSNLSMLSVLALTVCLLLQHERLQSVHGHNSHVRLWGRFGGLGGCDGKELAVHCGVALAVVLVVLNFWLGTGVGLDFERGLG